jgi:hypothetical protein
MLANPEANTRLLYTCKINNSEDRMTSSVQSCEGQEYYGKLGYVFTVEPTDVRALSLWRCNMGGHHFDSVTDNCEGYTKEFRLGWVIA